MHHRRLGLETRRLRIKYVSRRVASVTSVVFAEHHVRLKRRFGHDIIVVETFAYFLSAVDVLDVGWPVLEHRLPRLSLLHLSIL